MARARFSLIGEIVKDFVERSKVLLLLVLLVSVSAAAVVWVTADTRKLNYQQRVLAREIINLEKHYLHLEQEESALTEGALIERQARSIGLGSVKREQEEVLERR